MVVDARARWTWILPGLLVLPAALFLGANILKFELGIAGPYEWLGPLTDPSRSVNDLVTAIVLLGPALALAIALWPIVRVRFAHPDEEVRATVSLRLRWPNIAVAVVALGVLAVLLGHVAVENAACWLGNAAAC